MMTALLRGALAVGFMAVGLPPTPFAQDLPLHAEVVGIARTAVEYVLTNQGPIAATAWAVELTSLDSAGEKRRGGQTTETYITTAHPQLDPLLQRDVLESQARRRLTASVGTTPGATLVNVDVRVVAVVLEDGSSIGDAAIIDEIFAARRAERDTYVALLRELRAAISKGGRPEDLEALAVKVEKNREKYPAPNVAGGLLQNLNLIEARMRSGTSDSNTALEALESTLRIQHAAAVNHAIRAR